MVFNIIMNKYKRTDLDKILPHDYPMILIDELLDVDLSNNTVKTAVKITKNKIFYDESIEGISPIVGIEFMAQTIGCYAYFQNGEQRPKIGYLLGSRGYKCALEKFEKDKSYTIEAKRVFADNELVSFECFIYNDSVECARATVNVYQPQSTENII